MQTCGEKLLTSGLQRDPACHPERSEGSRSPDTEILRCAQDDRPSLHMSVWHEHGYSTFPVYDKLKGNFDCQLSKY